MSEHGYCEPAEELIAEYADVPVILHFHTLPILVAGALAYVGTTARLVGLANIRT